MPGKGVRSLTVCFECQEVPQRIEEQNAATEEESAGIPGVWGSWGPWSACSRSCSSGVMEQTRPCLPGYYYERSYHRPGQFSASERMLPHPQPRHQEDPLNPYSGHVISAIRTSVPLHRSEEQSRAGLRVGVYSGGRNDSHLGRGTPRGGRQSRRRSPKPERRGRNKNPIGPGKYGYGKVPYILPLQADTGQLLQKPRRQRQSTRSTASQPSVGVGTPFGHPVTPPHHHGHLYQEDQRAQSGPQVGSSTFYQQTAPHLPSSFPAFQSLFHTPDLSSRVPVSRQPIQSQASSQRTAAIVCIGAYKQYKLCNTN
ncbi:hypothetical protein lerEdw1_008601, partial [Lerista edwardsae]